MANGEHGGKLSRGGEVPSGVNTDKACMPTMNWTRKKIFQVHSSPQETLVQIQRKVTIRLRDLMICVHVNQHVSAPLSQELVFLPLVFWRVPCTLSSSPVSSHLSDFECYVFLEITMCGFKYITDAYIKSKSGVPGHEPYHGGSASRVLGW